ncbi:hypothetical protein VNO80_07840 [Phaseolus coccineus]|uniref:Uncharacterized protein n=1 Tax=Phaseolus coccineus TaxID=3886 RepID=A0AAN9NKW5_PHACN
MNIWSGSILMALKNMSTSDSINIEMNDDKLDATTSNNLPNFASVIRGLGCDQPLWDDNDVEDLEILLDVYFKQLDGIRSKIKTAVFTWFCYFSVSFVL